MKTTIFAVLCLFVCGATAYGQLSHFRSHLANLQARHHLDVCSLECRGAVNITDSSSWEIDLVSSANSTLILSLAYDSNALVVIHQTLKIAVVIDGKSGLVALLSLNNGGSLVVNIKAGLAVYAGGNASLKALGAASGKIEVSALVSLAITIINAGSSSVQPTSPLTGNTFNLSAIVIAIYKDSTVKITAEAFFNGRVSLYNSFEADFRVWLNLFIEQVGDGDLDASFGLIGLLAPVFDHPHAISVSILRLWIALYSTTSGQFSGKLALAIYNVLSVGVSAEGNTRIFASLIATIRAVGVIYVDLDAALTAYLNGSGLSNFNQQVVVIGGKNYVVSYGSFVDGSWFIILKSQSDDSVDVVIAYLKPQNIFVIYNRRLGVILVFSGSLGLFAIWNVKTGEGIIVRYSTGAAIVISADSSISGSFSSGALIQGFIAIAVKIQANASFSYSILNRATFLFSTYILTLQTAGYAAANALVSSSVTAIISNSFSVYFQAVAAARNVFDRIYGVLNIVFVAAGAIEGAWSLQIQKFIFAVYTSALAGRFSYNLFVEFYAEVAVNVVVIASADFLGRITAALKAIVSIGGSIEGTISHWLNTTLSGGASYNVTTGGGGGIEIGGGGGIEIGGGGGIQIGGGGGGGIGFSFGLIGDKKEDLLDVRS